VTRRSCFPQLAHQRPPRCGASCLAPAPRRAEQVALLHRDVPAGQLEVLHRLRRLLHRSRELCMNVSRASQQGRADRGGTGSPAPPARFLLGSYVHPRTVSCPAAPQDVASSSQTQRRRERSCPVPPSRQMQQQQQSLRCEIALAEARGEGEKREARVTDLLVLRPV